MKPNLRKTKTELNKKLDTKEVVEIIIIETILMFQYTCKIFKRHKLPLIKK